MLPAHSKALEYVCRGPFDRLIQLVREGDCIYSRFSQAVADLGVLVFEGKIYDCPKLRTRVVLLDFRRFVDNLVDALMKIPSSFDAFDVYRELDVAVRRERG